MAITGRCYCGEVRYEAEGAPQFKGQCHCRECQYISGGAENLFMTMPANGFRYVRGEPKRFTRADLAAPATREFCATCGTHLATRTPHFAAIVIVKVGTLDDPSVFGGAQAAVWTSDAPPYHRIPDGITKFPGFPGR
jgi:hypothetical protein